MRSRFALLAFLVFAASDAAAQSAFVEGGFAREVKRFSREGDRSPFDGTVNTVWVGVAGFLLPQVSVGAEMDLGEESTFQETVTVTVSGRPAEITTSYTSRRRSIAAFAGLHTSADRAVRLGCYVGLGFTAFRRTIGSDAPTVVLEEPPEPSVFEERTTGAIVGVDAAIRLGPNVAVVPAIRAQGLSLTGDLSGFSLRPSIGARVSF
jgi:hypothetical protein